jgi:hypothetical protein
MEDSEEVMLSEATQRPLCRFHYIDETFIIQCHGPDKVKEFLDHIPVLDMHIYRRPDSFLGHKV